MAALDLFSKKNGLVLVIAMIFALYQFNKHSSKGNTRTGSFQLAQTKKIVSQSIDLWKYEIVDGTNNRDDALLLILSRDSKSMSKQRPTVLAEIVADKRLARNRYKKRRGGGAAGSGHGRHGGGGRGGRGGPNDPPRRRRKSSAGRKSGGGAYGSGSYGGGGRGGGGRKRNRNGGGGRGGSGRRNEVPFYDGPPLLRLTVYDSEMSGLQDMLEQTGFIEKLPATGGKAVGSNPADGRAVGGSGSGGGGGGGSVGGGVEGSGSSSSSSSSSDSSSENSGNTNTAPTAPHRAKEEEELLKNEEILKRERKEKKRKDEENVKSNYM